MADPILKDRPDSELQNTNLAARIGEDEALEDELMENETAQTLKYVAEYSLQIDPVVLSILLDVHRRLICNPLVPEQQKRFIMDHLMFYKIHKRYHDTMGPLIRIIEAMFYKQVIAAGGGVKTQLTTMRQN